MSARRPALPTLVIVLAAIAWMTPAAPVHAQATRATLLGTITDQSGAALPGITVTATETRTNIARTTTTNATGNYTFPNIPDGVYDVKAELEGFKTIVREGVRVAVNTSVRIDLSLEVGGLQETVTVTGETPLLQTDRTDTGRTIESIQVASMPLSFNRNFQGLMATVPGSTRPYRPHSEFFNSQDSLSSEVNGQSRLGNNVQIEGIDNNHRTGLLTVLIPPAEAIDQVSVTTSNFDAEFGRAAGAVTSVILKSGTNTLRGSAFWFGNTEATNALPASTIFSTTRTKPSTTYNQVGFTLGGPIARNRLFFFGDYQYTRDILGSVFRAVVPTEAFRKGDFSEAPTKVYDPATGDPSGNGRTEFPNNQVPANRISPIAQAILANVPMPNLPGVALGQVNYQVNTQRDKITHGFDTKLNYAVDDANQVSWRFSYQRPEVTVLPPDGYANWGGPRDGGFMATGTNSTYSTALNWTRTFSNSFLMEARGGVSYYHNVALNTATGQNLAEQVGIRGVNLDEWTSGPTRIDITNGFSNPIVGYSNSLNWDRYERTWEFAATFTKLWGNHTFKFGGDWRHNSDMLLQTQDNGGPRGRYDFNGAMTGSPADSAANSGIANSFAAFLLDTPNNIARDLKVIEEPGTKHWSFFSFVHDKWQVSRKLTVDLGLRWEYYDPFVGITGRGSLSNYDPDTNTLRIAGYGSHPLDLGVKKDLNNWGPRLGVSYRLDEKTVVRGGFGGSTTPFPDNRYAFNYPVKQNNSFSGPNSFSPAGSMAAGFPAPIVTQIPEDGVIQANTPLLLSQSFWSISRDLQNGTIYSYNAAFQRELFWNITAEVAYVGNFSNDVLNRFNVNAGMTPGLDRQGQPLYVKYGKTASVELSGWKGKSRYNAVQVKVDRKFRGGWLITNSYTYGISKDSAHENGGPSTPADPGRSYGYSNFDRTHNYVGTFVWSLPWFKEGNTAAKWVLGNWQISGIFTTYTGTPLDITTNAALLRAPGNTQRPDLTGTFKVLDQYGPGKKWFDTSVFAEPAANTWGNMTRNMGDIRGPGFMNFDFSLVKQLPFAGTRMGEIRMDVWNLTNHVNYNNPNTTFGSATFGEINGAYGERQMRFSVRFLF